jgi:hypothetical protein
MPVIRDIRNHDQGWGYLTLAGSLPQCESESLISGSLIQHSKRVTVGHFQHISESTGHTLALRVHRSIDQLIGTIATRTFAATECLAAALAVTMALAGPGLY